MALTHWEVSVDYGHGGVACVATHHFSRDDASLETAEGVANAWKNAVGTQFRDVLPLEYSTVAVRAREIRPAADPQPAGFILPWTNAGLRTHTGELLAEWLACRTTLYTAFAGRQNRGASIMAGGTEGDTYGPDLVVGGGFWWTTVSTYFDNMLTAFGASGVEAPLRWVVFSRKRWLTSVDPTTWAHPVVSHITRSTLRGKRTRRVV